MVGVYVMAITFFAIIVTILAFTLEECGWDL